MGTETADRVFTATGLQPQTSYTFSVMAVNSEGEVGPPAAILANTETPAITETPAMTEGKQGIDSAQFLHGPMNSRFSAA